MNHFFNQIVFSIFKIYKLNQINHGAKRVSNRKDYIRHR